MKKALVIGICLLGAFVGGVLVQRAYPLGLLLLELKTALKGEGDVGSSLEMGGEAGVAWDGYWSGVDDGAWREAFFGGQAARIEKAMAALEARKAAEEARRADPKVMAFLGDLDEAVLKGEFSDYEASMNRGFSHGDISTINEKGQRVSDEEGFFECMVGFDKVLREAGIGLLVIPVPNTIDVMHSPLLGFEEYVSINGVHRMVLEQLWQRGVEAVDLRYELGADVRSGGAPYYERYGHHWGEPAMMKAARYLREYLEGVPFVDYAEKGRERFGMKFGQVEEEVDMGDLWQRLPEGSSSGHEWVRSVYFDGKPMAYDVKSPVVVIGDSMASHNGPAVSDVNGDFTSYLSREMGLPMYVLTKDGSAVDMPLHFARAVREEGITPQLVIWVFQAPRGRFIQWKEFDLSGLDLRNRPGEVVAKGDSEVVSGDGEGTRVKVVRTSALPDPKASPYPDALMVMEVEVLGGGALAVGERVQLVVWAFEGRELLAGAKVKAGDEISVRLEDWGTVKEADKKLKTLRIVDDIADFLMPQYWGGAFR